MELEANFVKNDRKRCVHALFIFYDKVGVVGKNQYKVQVHYNMGNTKKNSMWVELVANFVNNDQKEVTYNLLYYMISLHFFEIKSSP